MVKNLPAMQEIWVRPVGGKIPWRKKWQPTAVVLPARSHGQRSLVGYSPRGHKELGMTERVTTQNVKHCFRTLESDLRSKKWRVEVLAEILLPFFPPASKKPTVFSGL